MLPGASTIKEDAYLNEGSAPTTTPTLAQAFFDFFDELVALFVHLGVKTTFSALEFSSLGSFPLFSAGGLGDGNLGDKGGDTSDEGLVLHEVEVGKGKEGKGGEEMGDFNLGTWLQVG